MILPPELFRSIIFWCDNQTGIGILQTCKYVKNAISIKDLELAKARRIFVKFGRFGFHCIQPEWLPSVPVFDIVLAWGADLFNAAIFSRAAEHGRLDLLQHMHQLNVLSNDRIDLDFKMAMEFGIQEGHIDIIKWLLDQRQIEDLQDCLCIAAEFGPSDVLRFFIEDDGIYSTLLTAAANEGRLENVLLLLTIRIPRLSFGNEALVKATKNGHFDVVRELVNFGLDEDTLTSALDCAYTAKKYKIAEFLVQSGARDIQWEFEIL